MDADKLLQRVKEIEASIVNFTTQLNALYGHKAEVLHWIEELSNATVVESPEIPVVE